MLNHLKSLFGVVQTHTTLKISIPTHPKQIKFLKKFKKKVKVVWEVSFHNSCNLGALYYCAQTFSSISSWWGGFTSIRLPERNGGNGRLSLQQW
eukprot:c45397_g1_i1 orf=34-315(-)